MLMIIGNGDRTEWSPIRSVIVTSESKLDSRSALIQFCLSLVMITDQPN